jgi:hypothetical protein
MRETEETNKERRENQLAHYNQNKRKRGGVTKNKDCFETFGGIFEI